MSGVADEDDDVRIAELQRAGIITPPSEPLSLDLVRTPLPRAALSIAGTGPASVSFVTLDQRLLDAAQREGLRVEPA